MKKILPLISLLFWLIGCGSIDDSMYPYPDSKGTTVTLAEYNQLKNGMSYDEVVSIIGGECTKESEVGDEDDELYTVTYGCNGSGDTGANVQLLFQGGELDTKAQFGLR